MLPSWCYCIRVHVRLCVQECAQLCALSPLSYTSASPTHLYASMRCAYVCVRVCVPFTQLVLKNGEKLPYGVCVWSTGNSTNPLVSELVNAIPEQPELNGKRNPAARKLAVDQFLRVVSCVCVRLCVCVACQCFQCVCLLARAHVLYCDS